VAHRLRRAQHCLTPCRNNSSITYISVPLRAMKQHIYIYILKGFDTHDAHNSSLIEKICHELEISLMIPRDL
jgi:hypothetical protein